MSTPEQQLLWTRLDALESDIEKVKGVVGEALDRGRYIDNLSRIVEVARAGEENIHPLLRQINLTVKGLNEVLKDVPDIRVAIERQHEGLVEQLKKTGEQLDRIRARLGEASEWMGEIKSTFVPLTSRSKALEESLSVRCDEALGKVKALEESLGQLGAAPSGEEQRLLWARYAKLLDDVRPLFTDYVDFLGGLTVRDTALDDRVCQMTDVLLGDFMDVTKNALSVPAHQPALSSAMNSVIKLGFPEWTTWAVPLVAHEVGLAVADDRNNAKIQEFLAEWASGEHPMEEVRELFADAFATLTMGPAYACAAILLRFQPHHHQSHVTAVARLRELIETAVHEQGRDHTDATDALVRALEGAAGEEVIRDLVAQFASPARPLDVPADVDRARLCLDLLRDQDPHGESELSESVHQLAELWDGAVVNLAAPSEVDEAIRAVEGPESHDDWLDSFRKAVLPLLESHYGTRIFGAERWASTEAWLDPLLEERDGAVIDREVPELTSTVLELLNAAWRARLANPDSAPVIAANLARIWRARNKPSSDAGI